MILGLLAAFVVAIISAAALFYHDKPGAGSFLLTCVSSFSVIVAVLIALFGDRLKLAADPLKLRVEATTHPNNEDDMHAVHRDVRLHHLRVKNLTPFRTVTRCRVLLEHVLDETGDGKFERRNQFAVPRMMDWAPNEFSREERSFADEQTFDFGFTRRNDGTFFLSPNPNQGGYLNNEQRFKCEPGKRRRYCFRISAENYEAERHQIVEVRAFSATLATEPRTEIEVVPPEKL